ncbi:hypothetical protein QYF36_011568 [Acer negundo]|nr:hypothetical protein QYF36_011568 [Acer negundo]
MPSKDAEEMNYCDDMHPLFDKKVAFPCLKKLILNELPGLLHLWKEDSQPSSVFGNLTSLTVSDCDNLETLVPSLVSLQKLRTLTTWELTAEGEKDAVINKITLFMLNSIVLEDLPSLTSFYSGSNTLECPSLKIIDIKACPEMETFVFPNTMDLSIHSASFFSKKAISWCLQNLTGLVMCDCDNLKYSFPSSMAEGFVHLEFLEVSNTKFMEGVIIIQEERKSSTLFPKLNQLKLKGLPKLTRFCNFNGNSIELPSLSRMDIQNCPKMQTFASDSLCADMPAIEEPEKMMNFSQGVLSTPKLQRVQLKEEKDGWRWEFKVCESSWEGEEDGGCWEGDINTTIQKLFKDMKFEVILILISWDQHAYVHM